MAGDHFARVLRLAGVLPGVEAGTSWGTPSLRVRKKFLARTKEDGETLVVPCAGLDEKDFLLATEPEVYCETPTTTAGPASWSVCRGHRCAPFRDDRSRMAPHRAEDHRRSVRRPPAGRPNRIAKS
ncbi:MAG: hypothetical protein HYX53_00075 [Chloroflexi bacterium]|nr:hypothetical protein [Chloroflexota bacterium]